MDGTKQDTMVVTRPGIGERAALVTGASRGIGEAIARKLDAQGFRVLLVARDGARLARLAEQLHDARTMQADLGEPDAPQAVVDWAFESPRRVDVLVNNAALSHFGPSEALDVAAIDGILAVNVRAALLLASRTAARMAAAGGGSIVNLSSILADAGTPRSSLYATTKGAIDAMTRALAAEWGPRGVRINSVRPGITRTDMAAGLLAMPAFEPHYNGNTALRRIGEPEEVADLVAFLASDKASYITGQLLTIDGGWGNSRQLLPSA